MTIFTDEYQQLPVTSGAYVLVMDMALPIKLKIRRFEGVLIEPGRYAYAGSARGPGGIRARCRRHLLKEKKLHWHVDHLTTRADRILVAAFPHGNECDLASIIMAATECHLPLPGFGSSDCPRCKSHLLWLKAQPSVAEIGFNKHDMA